MKELIVHGGKVILGVGGDNKAEVIEDGAIRIEDGEISEISSLGDLTSHSQNTEVIGGSNFVVCPGFVNAHHHVGITPFQLGTPDLPLELWIVHRNGGKVVPLYLDTLYSAFELIRSGVTTVQHLQGRISGPIENVYRKSHEVLRAYKNIGLRVSYSFSLRDQNRIVYEDDEEFFRKLPNKLATQARNHVEAQTFSIDDNLELFRKLDADVVDEETLAIQLAPINLQWCSDEALRRVRDVSDSFGTQIHMHLLETPYQETYGRLRSQGKSALEHIHRLGLVNERVTLGHGVWMTERDLDLIQEGGAHICHNCSSNMRLRSGRAPVTAMLRRGIAVALGIDEAGINDDRDMLQEMRLALYSNRRPGHSEVGVPSSGDIFRMATELGAKTTPYNSNIGRLDVGRAADMVLFDWDQVSYPYLDPNTKIIDALVQRAKCRDVHTVLINGEVVLQNGKITRIDEGEILDELAEVLNRPLTEEEGNMRVLVKELLPHVKKFYHGYC